jgi:UDP-perosamine 4-acetyltransferase
VLEALRGAGLHEIAGLTDPRPELHGAEVDGAPVLGDDGILPRLLSEGVGAAAIGVGGTGDNGPRERVFTSVEALGFDLPPVVSPAAFVAASARLGRGVVVLPAAVVGAGATLGRNVIVNSAAVVEHDCDIGDHVHVASGAILGGHTRVGAGAHVGLGASVRQGIEIGAGALVGAGAVVVSDVAPGTTVLGSPARARAARPAAEATS